ncbi:MAG: GNAT family N-acetyltransferase [Labrys sp. (in: a-proteobacteria)]
MTAPVIRPVAPGDLAAITAIYGEAVFFGSASFEIEPPPAEEMARRCETITAAGFPYLVAEIEGRVIGYAYAGPYRPRPAYRFTVEDSIYLDQAARGLGIGRLLLTALIERTTAMGMRQMIAVIGDSANLPSIRLHEALGFERAGLLRSVGWKHGRWIDSVLMQRSLGPGDGLSPAA